MFKLFANTVNAIGSQVLGPPWWKSGADLGGPRGPVPPLQKFFTYMLLLL